MTTVTKNAQGYTDVYIPFGSSVINTAWHDKNTQSLFIELTNGTMVGYSGFSDFSWLTFKNYDSPGKFWNHYIKNVYRGLNGDVELFDRNSYPQSPSVDDEDAVVDLTKYNPYEAFDTARVKQKFHVLVQVEAIDFADAVSQAQHGNVSLVSVTRL